VLQRIAKDETRHAALGWQFLRWALDVARADERSQILANRRAVPAH
jgi:hypothetical protein